MSLAGPWRLLGTQPIIQLLALYQAFNFRMLYLFISSFPILWRNRYGMSTGIGSLDYCFLALGLLVGAQVCGPLTGLVHKNLKKRYRYSGDSKGLHSTGIPYPSYDPSSLQYLAVYSYMDGLRSQALLSRSAVALAVQSMEHSWPLTSCSFRLLPYYL